MDKLVQHIKIDMPGIPKQGLYCYGEASFEANQEMQEQLEKLYKYEKQPDMREKVKEYISELDKEYDRCMDWIEEHIDGEACQVSAMEMRAKTLDAFELYSEKKKESIINAANDYKEIIPYKLYEALLNYEVRIDVDRNYVV